MRACTTWRDEIDSPSYPENAYLRYCTKGQVHDEGAPRTGIRPFIARGTCAIRCRTCRPRQASEDTHMDPMRRKILATGAAAAAISAVPELFAQQLARGSSHVFLRKRSGAHPLSGSRLRLPAVDHPRRRIELRAHRLDATPLTPSRNSRASIAASRPICATPIPANPPVRSRLTARGIPTPTTSSACSIISASTSSWSWASASAAPSSGTS